jgi:diguanylate cyclase (GGDEF)-like protein
MSAEESQAAAVSRRTRAVVAPVCATGVAVIVAAATIFASRPPGTKALVELALLLAASTIAERYPVPLPGVDANGVSLSFVFGLTAIVVYGWAAGVLVVAAAPAITQLFEHRPPIRVAFNTSAFALAAATSGSLIMLLPEDGSVTLVGRVASAGSAEYAVDMLLVSAVVAASSARPFGELIRSCIGWTAGAFALMTSAALALVVLWQRSPLISPALVGPLIAIALYQRSSYRELRAMRLAMTDPLTGLGNHRSFQERLQRELDVASAQRTPFALCLIDVDDLKRINDRYGHPAGDRLLSHVASQLRRNGETFRLGGDEFAILLPRHTDEQAMAAARAIVERISALPQEHGRPTTVSAGIAAFPGQARERDELIQLADAALYWAKEDGKNRAHAYRHAVAGLAELKHLAADSDAAARRRAALALAEAADARDAYIGKHSKRVGKLAARLAARLGLATDEIEDARLAGILHDIGKIAIPEEILRKPDAFGEAERKVVERHPEIAFRMLDPFGVGRVAHWVLHHHEHWDGHGYPDGLRGAEIPLVARILLVADAFDAMTSGRVYEHERLTPTEALFELERCAGSQFDPEIVSMLAEETGLVPEPDEVFVNTA